MRIDVVAELIQRTVKPFDPVAPKAGSFKMRGCVALLIANQPIEDQDRAPPHVRYVVPAAKRRRPHATPRRSCD